MSRQSGKSKATWFPTGARSLTEWTTAPQTTGPWACTITLPLEAEGWVARGDYEIDPHTRRARLLRLSVEPLNAEFEIDESTGRAHLSAFGRHRDVEGEVTANTLRSVRTGTMHREVETQLRKFTKAFAHTERGAAMVPVYETFRQGRAKGRPREISDDRLAEIADSYVKQLDARAPLREVAREFNYSYERARSLIELARNRGLLSETTQGKKAGSLTAAGEAALKKRKV
jgi:hypothetical protein